MTLIAVDIGNTSIHMARLAGGHWREHCRVKTSDFRKSSVSCVKKLLPKRGEAVVVIASVVPSAGKFLRAALRKRGVRSYLIGRDFPVPIKNLYTNPRQVGIDRLLNALAGYQRFKKPLIIVDFGTAITFDVVSGKGEYLGGIIAPGIEISLEALFNKTALLPKIRLEHPRNLIGKDTVDSIRVGCSVGIGGLCDRIIEAVEKKKRFRANVLATGGYARFMARYCRKPFYIDQDLIFKGIELCWRKSPLK